jgi:signal peptidase I
VLAAALWLFVFQVSVVHGQSMCPSLEPDDRLVVDKFGLQWRTIDRFDVVVFERSEQPGVDYVKRVVGLPGETVELCAGELYVDGEPAVQHFPYRRGWSTCGPVELGEDEYFVLGDNRPRSRDSRSFGAVRRGKIKGVVRFRVYPFGRMGTL